MEQKISRLDLDGVNCYLARTGDGFILFDTGGHLTMDKEFTNRRGSLEKELERAGCVPGNLKLIVITHGDNDHVSNAKYIREKYKTKIAMHKDDLELVESPALEKVMKTFNYKPVAYKIMSVFMKKLFTRITEKVLKDFESFKPDLFLEEGESLAEYGFNARVLHTPGHTPGSIAVLSADGDLISGDTLANIKKPGISPNAMDFRAMAGSLRRLKDLDIKNIFPGHGEPFSRTLLKQ